MADGRERIAAAFATARAEARPALMPYLMAGFPDHGTSLAVASAYVDAGANLVELGVPYSDPLADGPTIHDAATRALAAGATLERSLEVCASISHRLPTVPMVYANVVLRRGPERFAELLADAGAAAAIVPDLPLEEAEALTDALAARGLPLVPLVAPTTPAERRRRICAAAEGFVYVVSLAGVTGERGELSAGLGELVAAVREEAAVPAAVGFGIGTSEQAASVGRIADGVIIGSRLVRAAGEAGSPEQAGEAVAAFLGSVRAATAGLAASAS